MVQLQSRVPALRVTAMNEAPVVAEGRWVLYWMIAHRRARWSFSLDRAIEWAKAVKKPLLVLEPLRVDYRWASDRLHRFVIDGMRDNARVFEKAGIAYHPYVEPEHGAGKHLLASLARDACVIVTDEYPCFFLPQMVKAAAGKVAVRMEAIDSNGLVPLRAPERLFVAAHSFRRWQEKNLPEHLGSFPSPNPLARLKLPRLERLPDPIIRSWPRASETVLAGGPGALSRLPIDHGVAVSPIAGGSAAGSLALDRFVRERLDLYPEGRNHPDASATSGLSPYLHFGHVSAHQVYAAIADRSDQARDAFIDQLVTWRELGFNFCFHRPDDYDALSSLPTWAQATLEAHAADERPRYSARALEAAKTADPIWNAAQTELVREGTLHNYLRMLWGKKILEWSKTPKEALERMIHFNNKYALDGRDPNSYSGILWTLGRYDRPWPARPIFGAVRTMTSNSAARKLRMREYLKRYEPRAHAREPRIA